jgi:hypothetical protein
MAVARILVSPPVQQLVYMEQDPPAVVSRPVNPIQQQTSESQARKVVEKPVKPEQAVEKSAAPDKITPPVVADSADGRFLLIQQNWKKINEQIRKINPGTQGLVNSSKLQAIKDGILILAFASDMVKEKMDTSANLETVRSAIQQTIALDIPVRCVVSSKTAAVKVEYAAGQKSLVNSAINELGGKVVDVKDAGEATIKE